MKRIALFVLLFGTLLTSAQSKKHTENRLTPEQRLELHLKKLKLDLNLDEKQMAEIAKSASSHLEKIKGIKEKQMKLKEQMNALHFEEKKLHLEARIAEKENFKKILTDEQYKLWNQKVALKERNSKNRHPKPEGQKL